MISKNVTRISAYAFTGCDITYIEVEENNPKYTDIDGIVYNKEITSLIMAPNGMKMESDYVIPNSVITIESYALAGCTGFTGKLVIPDSVTTIGSDAFGSCGFTGDLVIPDSVTKIYYYAFSSCKGFNGNLTIGTGLEEIPYNCFAGCSGLTGELVIPDNIKVIGGFAFDYCTGFSGKLILPNGLKSISQNVFEGCSGLTGNLVIPDGVTSIDYAAFSGCSGFTGELKIPDSVTSIGTYAFNGCSGFTGELKIPNGITSISSGVFSNCTGLIGTLTIPNTITSIGDNAFYGCTGFEGNLVIPNSVTSIGASAFYNCNGFIGDLIIVDSVASVGAKAFQNCTGFNGNLTIGNKVTSIGQYAFQNCTGFNGNLTIGNAVTSIGQYAFSDCIALKGNITIGNKVTSIGQYAFQNCSGLSGDLTIPNTVTSIGQYAFYGCSGFTGSLSIPDGVKTISDYAFYKCSGFTGGLIIPSTVTTLGKNAFSYCSGFNGNLTIGYGIKSIGNETFYGCSGFTGDLIIPENVTSIGNSAFYGCSGFNGNLTISDTVTTIGTYAFSNCSGFTGSLVIPDSLKSISDYTFSGCSGFAGDLIISNKVTSIGKYAFQNCRGFTGSLNIPNTVTSIGAYAFNGCSGFTGNLIIPESLTSISEYVFVGCGGLSYVLVPNKTTVPKHSSSYTSFDNNKVFALTGELATIYKVNYWNRENNAKGVYSVLRLAKTAPEKIKQNSTFVDDGVTVAGFLEDPTGLFKIKKTYERGGNTFDTIDTSILGAYTATYTLQIKNGDTYVDVTDSTGVIEQVTRIIEVIEDVEYTPVGEVTWETKTTYTYSDEYGTFTYIKDNTAKYARIAICVPTGTKVEFPEYVDDLKVINIEPLNTNFNVFGTNSSYTKETEIYLPNSLEIIGNRAFRNCSGLTQNLIIPDNVTSIGDNAFSGCYGFTGELIIPDNVTSIGTYAFSGCYGFTGSLIIPDSVTSIGTYAFNGCSGFTGNLILPDGITSIEKYAFYKCSNFTGKLKIPSSVINIGESAFCDCSGLTGDLIIPNSVTSIGTYAFQNCRGFNGKLKISNNITTMGDSAFCNCSFTGNLTIPDSIISIGFRMFSGCTGFTGNLIIPDSVTSIGSQAFYGCTGFTGNLIIPDSVTSVGSAAFYNCVGFTGELKIPSGVTSIEASVFKSCKGLIGELKIPNNVTSIGSSAFYGCTGFTGNLIIPDSVTSIGSSAFYGCSGLTGTLTIPNGVTSIPSETFSSCKFTGNLIIPNGVTSIGRSAFSGCTGFTGNLIIPNNVTNIEGSAFSECRGFTGTLTLGNNLTTIGGRAFYWCNFTGNLILPNSVTSIGSEAFNGCDFTGSLVISNSVITIENSAFYGCKGFTGELIIPDSVTKIGNSVFSGCTGFSGKLIIGNSVTTIGNYAFTGCTGLVGKVLIPASVETIGTTIFYGCTGLNYIEVDENNVSYKDIEGIVYSKDGTTLIMAPIGMKYTKDYIIPDGVTSIENYALYNCAGFTGKLIIPDSVTSIGTYAFNRCSGFTGSLIIPDSVTSIGDYAFSGCNGFNGNLIISRNINAVTSVIFPDTDLIDYVLVPNTTTIPTHNSSNDFFERCKVYALTNESAELYKVNYWNKENNGDGVYPVLQARTLPETVKVNSTFIDTGATVAGLYEDPNGLFKLKRSYQRIDDVAVASLANVRFAEGEANASETLDTSVPGTYLATYTLQMLSGDTYVDVTDSTGKVEQVTREIIVEVGAPEVTDILVESPEDGEYGIGTQITFNVLWNKDVVVETAPDLTIKFSDSGDAILATYVGTENNISTYKYTLTKNDIGYLILDGYADGKVNDAEGNVWISSEITFDNEIYATGKQDQTVMITEWTIPSGDTEIILPVSGTVNLTVDWGDGSEVQTVTKAFPTHIYSGEGTYDIKIKGRCSTWGKRTNKIANVASGTYFYDSTQYLTGLKQWGELGTSDYGFSYCENLEYVSGDATQNTFNNVTNMMYMFYKCSSLTSLDLSNFNTSNVRYMSNMFTICSSLTSLDLSKFDTSKVTDMKSMFSNCKALTSLNLSNLNTSNVTDMSFMFDTCSALTDLNLSNLNAENVTNMENMFNNCTALMNLNLTGFKTLSVTSFHSMFSNCSALISIDLSGFKTPNLQSMYSMFAYCSSLKTIDLSSFDVSNVTNMGWLFYCCSKLESVEFGDFNTKNVTNMSRMFEDCLELKRLDLSSFNTSKVNTMLSMFAHCEKLAELNISSFDTKNVLYMDSMFYFCKSLTSLNVNNFDTSKVLDMGGMFDGCSSLTSLDISNFNTANATRINQVFTNCTNLNSIQISNKFDINTDVSTSIFSNSKNLNKIIVISPTPSGDQLAKISSQLADKTIYVPNESLGDYRREWTSVADERIQPILAISKGDEHIDIGTNFIDDATYTVAGYTEAQSGDYTVYGYDVEKTGTVDTYTKDTYPLTYTLTRTYSSGDTKITEETAEESRNIIVDGDFAPSNLLAQGDSTGTMTITFDKVDGTTVVLEVRNDDGTYKTLSTDATSPYLHENLNENTTYEYRAYAIKNGIKSEYVYTTGMTPEWDISVIIRHDNTKPEIELETVTPDKEFLQRSETLTLVVNTSDRTYDYDLSDIKPEDLIIKVGGDVDDGAIKGVSKINTASGETYTFTITSVTGTGEISIVIPDGKIIDKAGNVNDETVFDLDMYINSMSDYDITITPDVTELTSGDVNVTINYDGSDYTKEYSYDNNSWTAVTDNEIVLKITENKVVYARLRDDTITSDVVSYSVENIDKEKPVIGAVTVQPTGKANTKTITVTGIEDKGVSGLKGYFVSTTQNVSSATWKTLSQDSFEYIATENKTHYIWVIDKVGNISDVATASVSGIVDKVSNADVDDKIELLVFEKKTPTLTYDGEPETKVWTIEDEDIATINPDTGEITGVKSGDTTAKVTLTNYDGTKVELEVKVIVRAFEMNLEITGSTDFTFTYGDLPKETTFTTNSPIGIEVLSNDENVATAVIQDSKIIITPANVGTAKITIQTPETNGYVQISRDITVTVVPKDLIVEWSDDSFIYDGTVKEVFAIPQNLVAGDDITIEYEGNYHSTAGICVATIVKLTGPDSANYSIENMTNISHEWVIHKAERELNVVPDNLSLTNGESADITFTYTGEDVETLISKFDDHIINASLIDGGHGGTISVDALTAGETTILLTVPESDNYKGTTKEIKVSMALASSEIVIEPELEMVYGEAKEILYSYNGNGDVYMEVSDSTVIAVEHDKTNKILKINPLKASDDFVTITLSADKTDVYEASEATLKVKVNKRDLVVTWSEDTFTYDGNKKTVTAIPQNLIPGDIVIIKYTGNEATNVGNYTATITGIEGSEALNYSIENLVNPTHSWAIQKAKRNVTCQDKVELLYGVTGKVEFTYDGPDATATVTIGNTNVATIAYEDLSNSGKITITPVAAGTTEITITIPGTANYDVTTVTIPVKVDLTTPHLSTEKSALEFVYGDEAQHVAFEVTQGVLVYASSLDTTIATVRIVDGKLEIAPENVGTTKIKLATVVTDKYTSRNVTIDVTVIPRPVKLDWGNKKLIYNGTERTITATIANAVAEGEVVVETYEGNTATEIGNYVARATKLSNPNYTLTGGLNIETDWSIDYITPPEIKVTQNGIKVSSGNWASGDVVVEVVKHDETDVSYQYSYNNSEWYEYTSPLTLTDETTGTKIYARAYSEITGVASSAVAEYILKLDKTNPLISLDTLNTKGSINGIVNKNSEVTILLNIKDLISGIEQNQFTVDDIKLVATDKGQTIVISSVTKVLESEGSNAMIENGIYNYVLTLKNINANGKLALLFDEGVVNDRATRYNSERTINIGLIADNSGPEIGTIKTSADKYGKVNEDFVELEVEATDVNGIKSYEWQVSTDGRTWETFIIDETSEEKSNVIYDILEQGTHYFRVIVSDIMGNTSISRVATINLDTSLNRKPTIRFETRQVDSTSVEITAIVKSTYSIDTIKVNSNTINSSTWNITKTNNEITTITSYEVTLNGTYTWTIADIKGNIVTEKINISTLGESAAIVTYDVFDATENAPAKIEFRANEGVRITKVIKPNGTVTSIINGKEITEMSFSTIDFSKNINVKLGNITFEVGTKFVFENKSFVETEVTIDKYIQTKIAYVRTVSSGTKLFSEMFGSLFNAENAKMLINKMLSKTNSVNGRVSSYYGMSSSGVELKLSDQDELNAIQYLADATLNGETLKLNAHGDYEKLKPTITRNIGGNNSSYLNGNITGFKKFGDVLEWTGNAVKNTFRITIRAK